VNRLKRMASWMLAAGAVMAARPVDAQLTCTVTVVDVCTVGGTASAALTITISSVARVTMASSAVAMPAPTDSAYNSGFGSPGSVSFEVRANAGWTLVISSASTLWGFSPPSARSDKPRSDLQWSLSAGGSYLDVTGTQTTFASGTATNSSVQTLYLRSKYSWLLDRPGSYTIPVSITLTAP
jgi:hypothetical protein